MGSLLQFHLKNFRSVGNADFSYSRNWRGNKQNMIKSSKSRALILNLWRGIGLRRMMRIISIIIKFSHYKLIRCLWLTQRLLLLLIIFPVIQFASEKRRLRKSKSKRKWRLLTSKLRRKRSRYQQWSQGLLMSLELISKSINWKQNLLFLEVPKWKARLLLIFRKNALKN